MDLLLERKRILVTGGTSGIGLACARVLAEEGADVIVSSRTTEKLQASIPRKGLYKGSWHTFQADLSVGRDIEKLTTYVKNDFGYIDGLIINSGGPPLGSVLDHSDEAWISAFNTLLMSAVRLTRAFVPGMRERRFGRIISISSTGVKQPISGLVLSNSIRQATGAYLKTLSIDVASDNVFINTLLPGSTDTQRLQSLHESMAKNMGKPVDDVIDSRKRLIPAGKFGKPSDIAHLAAFLLSEKNGYITGQSIAVDGGMVTYPL